MLLAFVWPGQLSTASDANGILGSLHVKESFSAHPCGYIQQAESSHHHAWSSEELGERGFRLCHGVYAEKFVGTTCTGHNHMR